ncbi:hypothetical protein BT96DRAFT_1000078 [Gymnopus androsaceus JB14]|uniref:N-acetyltransferase domain-containing protein n=1 Tax=Gymnopus androsaceus JB14 TaxID=1447944 RepID=A0A6A4H4S0_9AGAR|nr:hypothetical protein BT96DRAFT_1000078 [Gymnopus androsaceus JB14]
MTSESGSIPTVEYPFSLLVEGIFTIPNPSFRASISAHTPILFDQMTNEPYLPLPAPLGPKFRLTPVREGLKGDVGELTRMMNDPKVVYWMDNHPFPFPSELAEEWIHNEMKLTEEIFAAFAEEGGGEGKWRPAKGSPLKVIRKVIIDSESGSNMAGESQTDSLRDIYVGEVDLRHGHWWSERMTPVKDHWEDWRDKERVWSIGAMLKPSYHNLGIGSSAISTLFYQWGIPHIGCTEVRAGTYVSNVASNRLWEKLGFVHSGLPNGRVVVQKEKLIELGLAEERGEKEEKEEEDQVLLWTLP